MEKKEAMKILKDFHDKSALFSVRTALDTLIPELKEPEDERIRKELIELIGCMHAADPRKKVWITWLEKQGEKEADQRYKYLEDLLAADDIYQMAMNEAMVEEAKTKAINALSKLEIGKLLGLEKQGDQPQGKTALEAAKEEKVDNANKVEPKFHKGEWVVWENKCYKVNYNGCGYELIDQNGLRTSLEYGTVDTSSRLWDITIDAKDGDVLVFETDEVEWIFIYREIVPAASEVPHDLLRYYFLLTGNYLNNNGVNAMITDDYELYLKPATKEQRDILMKAMADAGWQFDFEKKELKKVENENPLLSDFFKAEYERGKADAQKSAAWSEEDKKKLNRIYMLLAEASDEHAFSTTCRLIGDKECVELQDFLRSLKPQPKQELSEDDEQMVEDIIEAIDTQYASSDYNEMVNWLLSLKDRVGCEANFTTTWKPSEEQIQCLHDAIEHYQTNGYPASKLNELYEQMSKIYKL